MLVYYVFKIIVNIKFPFNFLVISWSWVHNPKDILINNFIAVTTFHARWINMMFLCYRLLAKELQGKDCWKQYLDYERSLIKREINKCWIDFFKKCIQTDIIPAFLKFRVPDNGSFQPTVAHNFQRRILKRELNKANATLYEHEQKVNDTHEILRQIDVILQSLQWFFIQGWQYRTFIWK